MLYIKESRGDIFKIIGANVRYYRGLYNLNHPDKRISQAKMAHMCNVSTVLLVHWRREKFRELAYLYFGIFHKYLGLVLKNFLKIARFKKQILYSLVSVFLMIISPSLVYKNFSLAYLST